MCWLVTLSTSLHTSIICIQCEVLLVVYYKAMNTHSLFSVVFSFCFYILNIFHFMFFLLHLFCYPLNFAAVGSCLLFLVFKLAMLYMHICAHALAPIHTPSPRPRARTHTHTHTHSCTHARTHTSNCLFF
jgi:hypothetical protein